MSKPAASPPPATTQSAIPAAAEFTPDSDSVDVSAALDRMSEKYDIPGMSAEPPVENTPPPAEKPPETDAGAPPVAPPAVRPPSGENAATGAARRHQEKQLAKDLEDAKAKLAELESLQSKYSELETKSTEFRTLAEQREIDLKRHQERFTNETSVLDESLLGEVPEVRTALEQFNQVAQTFFPKDVSDPSQDEADRRFNPSSLTNDHMRSVEVQLRHWREAEEKFGSNPARAADVQHIAISNIAKMIGVSEDSFNTRILDGKEYFVLRPSHPVYRHLKEKVPAYVSAQAAFEGAKVKGRTDRQAALQDVISTRRSNTSKMYSDAGVGLSGESLQKALEKMPDSPILNAMKLAEGDEELMNEIKQNVELETALNGVFRPHLDLAETDLDARQQASMAHMTRIGQRAVLAPLALPIMKLARRQAAELAEARAELAKLKAENDRYTHQAEPGGVPAAAGAPPEVKPAGEFDDILDRIASRHNVKVS